MTTKLTLDRAGRVVIPKPLRDELQLAPGDALDLESEGEQITLRPARGALPLRKEDGIWVLRTGDPLPASVADQVIKDLRNQRDLNNLGLRRRR